MISNRKMKVNKQINGRFTRFTFLIVLLIVFLIFAVTQPNFASIGNILEILRQGSLYFILLTGLSWVLATGEIDCSFPDVAACASTCAAVLINKAIPVDIAVIMVIALCSLFGIFSGFLVTKFKFPAIIVTIAVSSIARAFGLIAAGGKNITMKMQEGFSVFKFIASASIGGIPVILIIGLILAVIMWFMQEKRRLGQYVYAVADNRNAAKNAGIHVKRIVSITFLLSAVFAGLGGCLLGLNAGSGRPFMGSLIFLDSFTKVFLGAMVIRVGKVNIIGTYIGCIFLNLVSNGLTFIGATSWVQSIVTGVLLIAGVLLTSVLEQKRRAASQMEA